MHTPALTATRIETFAARLVMIVMAAGTAYTGYSLITQPLAIPVAVVLWLGATAIFFLGLWGKLPHDA
jgi:hypothetical protein